MSKKVLGLDLGINSIGWALLEESQGRPHSIIGLGCRVFSKAGEEKTPVSKNVKRRNAKLNRRILQRRAGRKQRMLNYLLKLNLLPEELQASISPETILNRIGNPYHLRAKALDQKLSMYELGRVILHFTQRRGFSSSHNALLGDMIDDPDVLAVLAEPEEGEDNSERDAEEAVFKQDVGALRTAIKEAGCRTLGEYLSRPDYRECKRNRAWDGRTLRTDRQMHEDELELIWRQQQLHYDLLTEQVKERVKRISFYQRPLKLHTDRIGWCALEPKRRRAGMARLESQRFRYLQVINSLTYFNGDAEKEALLSAGQQGKLIPLFETEASITFAGLRRTLGFDKTVEFNLERENKQLKGNVTACAIRRALGAWDELGAERQQALVEDLLTISKKSVLKKRLVEHWGFEPATAANLCLLELEPGYSHLSIKAINKLLPFLYQGQSYADARISAGYGHEVPAIAVKDKLGRPPEIANPIVQQGLHELRRLINALIAEYGKPDAIKVQMARDLKMNTGRYAAFVRQQKANIRMNEEAVLKFQGIKRQHPHLSLTDCPSETDKIKYRLWQDQHQLCAYSGRHIIASALFGPEIAIGHILPYSQSLDDSYMNKVVCYSKENSYKGRKTPIEAFGGGNKAQWHQIEQNLDRWDRRLASKKKRFFMTAEAMQKSDFIDSQLNDARYISRVAHDYLKQLGADISVSKGTTTAWVRGRWGLNDLLGEASAKDRTDHRHHAIDALVVACIDRQFYKNLSEAARDLEHKQSELNIDDLPAEPAWRTLKEDLRHALDQMIVAHAPQLKLSGGPHGATWPGQGHRRTLDGAFTQVDKIIDPAVKEIVRQHLQRRNGKSKVAFAETGTIYHQDGQTPIKQVRTLHSKTPLARLMKAKFDGRDRQGRNFSNFHHVEIFKDKNTGQYSGEFVTAMEASQRAKGSGRQRQPIIKTDHAERFEFVMALHVNDTVSIEQAGRRFFYRVRKLDGGINQCVLRLHSTAIPGRKNEEIYFGINEASFAKWRLRKHKINAIGKLIS